MCPASIVIAIWVGFIILLHMFDTQNMVFALDNVIQACFYCYCLDLLLVFLTAKSVIMVLWTNVGVLTTIYQSLTRINVIVVAWETVHTFTLATFSDFIFLVSFIRHSMISLNKDTME